MPSRLNPYLQFSGNARDAMEFYKTVFGGELTVSTFGEFGGDDAAIADQVMHAQLETERGFTLMASDPPPGAGRAESNGAISLSGEDGDELRDYWQKLSAGGTVVTPLEKQMWGDGRCSPRGIRRRRLDP